MARGSAGGRSVRVGYCQGIQVAPGILTTAVDEDKILQRNPCRVRGADKENPAERPILTIPQVFDLAGRMPERFRALVLLAAFASLRWGEVSALRRCDIAEDGSWDQVGMTTCGRR
jgi:integrase